MAVPSHFDLVVIGGGPAGTSGALAAGLLGKRAALIEQQALIGGAGINTGTIPSKTLRETALMLSGWRSRQLFGVDLSLRREATIADFMGHAKHVSRRERERTEERLAQRGVVRFHGAASFVDAHTVRIVDTNGTETLIHGEYILIATGSSPLRPAEFDFSDPRVHDSNEILELTTLPKKLVVVGGGVIGSEYAGTFAALGTEVHLADGRDTLMPFLDAEISRGLAAAMNANGVRFLWKEKVVKCDTSDPGDVLLTLSSGATIAADGVLVCAGRSSNTTSIDLAAAGLTPGRRGLVQVGVHYRSTEVPHIYGAGDVIGPPALAATGIEQARVAVFHAFGNALKSDLAPLLPTGIYTIPEASCVGETEAALTEKGIPYVMGRARYGDIPRGDIIGDDKGFLKLLYHRDDMRLLGVHVMGEHATELVHIGLTAMLSNATAELFNRACFNYPTLGDLYKYATYDAIMRMQLGLR
ncbi:MAG: Si-specific NAD(P)(+) transhydrogenase [Flavobacteriales bacterium]|nr:Si-specific NAD(P)(+) transhydrogenase [Flavobacteriales bacterium]